MKSTVETKISELVKLGHERAAELKGSFEAINACSVAQMISDLASQLEVQFARSNALAAKLSMINGLMDAAEQANKLAQEATEKLVQERDALAAELSAVESIHNDAVFITDEHYEQCPREVQKIVRSLAVLQIPAYDSFLDEVRAQDLNAFIQHHSAELDAHIKNGGEQFDEKSVRIRDIIVSARLFMEQLRKGGAA
ncbi:hNH endonuclease [Citrobacter koseri]|uniref:hNH endonuclease n=1 Tax=Citrobacter koseri TaxID=545 RepID=UPI0027D0DA0F|nr:hNH endonuclease [Citrobacter koseri]MDQ2324561.1 hNH endonuclease [Citrobacter koseri]WOI92527.1 hNH endonuclease [Citrobacter koseri]WOJ15790.1 hNH endonuclease [Citrobacter koseri]WOJ22193.1 hNH endonuclease [Citrobacter koseri]